MIRVFVLFSLSQFVGCRKQKLLILHDWLYRGIPQNRTHPLLVPQSSYILKWCNSCISENGSIQVTIRISYAICKAKLNILSVSHWLEIIFSVSFSTPRLVVFLFLLFVFLFRSCLLDFVYMYIYIFDIGIFTSSTTRPGWCRYYFIFGHARPIVVLLSARFWCIRMIAVYILFTWVIAQPNPRIRRPLEWSAAPNRFGFWTESTNTHTERRKWTKTQIATNTIAILYKTFVMHTWYW